MLMMLFLAVALAVPEASQAPVGFSGRWIGEDVRMGTGGDTVDSAIDAHLLPRRQRTPPQRDLTIDERADAVDVARASAPRLSLPLTGAEVTTKDGSGNPVRSRALREGATLVIRRTHQLRFPDGSPVVIEIEERYERLHDGTLQVVTTSTSGALVHTQRTVYRRVQ